MAFEINFTGGLVKSLSLRFVTSEALSFSLVLARTGGSLQPSLYPDGLSSGIGLEFHQISQLLFYRKLLD